MSAQYPANLVLEDDGLRLSKILIIAHRDLFVGGIIRLLEASDDSVTVTCVAPGEPCSRYFAGVHPDLLLLQQNAIPEPFENFIREMVEGFQGLRVLIFGQAMPDDYLYQVIHAGAHGYINEKMNDEHVSAAISAVRDGRYWVERHITERFIADASLVDGIHARVRSMSHRLTSREAEVLGLVMMGLSTSEIAERVFLSHQGVKAHLTTLFRKFGVKNRSQLILRALDEVTPVESISGLMCKGLQAARSANRMAASLQRQR
ncbi:MAG: response regulator transcription factor [Gammaproteobacteria bacterium]